MTSWRETPTPYFTNKSSEAEAKEHKQDARGKWVPTPGEGGGKKFPSLGMRMVGKGMAPTGKKGMPPWAKTIRRAMQRSEQRRRQAMKDTGRGINTESAAPKGPKIYFGNRRLRVEATGDHGFRLVDSEGRVHRQGAQSEIEHHIGEQLRRGKYKAIR